MCFLITKTQEWKGVDLKQITCVDARKTAKKARLIFSWLYDLCMKTEEMREGDRQTEKQPRRL